MRKLALISFAAFASLCSVVSCGSDAGDTGGTSGGGASGKGSSGRGATGGSGGTHAANGGNGGTDDSAGNGGRAGTSSAEGGANVGSSQGGMDGGAAATAGSVGGAGGSDSATASGGMESTAGNATGGASAGADGAVTGGAAGEGPFATEGEPCPTGDECSAGYVCVGYGNPLPNGEYTACRKSCQRDSPPAGCTCHAAGFCEPAENGDDCQEMVPNPGCADANPETLDFQSAVFGGCAHWAELGETRGWIQYGSLATGFAVDVASGRGWLLRSAAGTMNQAQAKAYCESLAVGGVWDWRLPSIDEVRSLTAGCSATAEEGSCPLSDAACLDTSCGIGAQCNSCTAHSGPHGPGGDFCRPESTICIGMHTSSACTDCGTPSEWRYGVGNGNFYTSAVDAQSAFPVCVTTSVPRGVPCRQ